MSATVIVEPDSASAWIGLVGVALGVLLSSGTAWLQSRGRARKERKAEIQRACSEVLITAQNVQLFASGMRESRAKNESALAWIQVMAVQVERVQAASDLLMQLGDVDLGVPAHLVARAAVAAASEGATQETADKLAKMIMMFRTQRRRVTGIE